MNLKFKQLRNVLVVSFYGELDHHTAEMVRVKIDSKLEEKPFKNVIFDFSGVTFMDSSGIGVVIGRYRKVSEYGGKVLITSLRPDIKRIFEVGGLFKIISEYKDVECALSSLA